MRASLDTAGPVCERTVQLKESYPTAMNAAIFHAEESGIWTEAIENAMEQVSLDSRCI